MNLLDMYDSKNYANDLIKQSIKNMKYENNQSRYMFIDKLLDYYQGDDRSNYKRDVVEILGGCGGECG